MSFTSRMLTRKRWRPAVLCSALALGVAVAAPAANGFAAQPNSSAVPAKLVGAWSRNVKQANVLVGVWTMVVKKNGETNFYTPGGYRPGCIAKHTCISLISTSYAVAGGRMTVGPLSGTFVTCGAKAIYSWKVSGQSLTLKAVADTNKDCAPRKALFSGVWKRTGL
jgi:hypothetical protein